MTRYPENPSSTAGTRRYYVDEAGDGTLFSRRGRVVVGTEGCSRYFILGFADIVDPDRLYGELEDLRQRLSIDPYFRGVPSIQPGQGKTARAFHAKDDLPEVRREVMAVILRHEMRFFAEVRDKLRVVQYVLERGESDPTYHYHPNELYDYLVRRLFKDHLHKADACDVCFAKRGSADRTAALNKALVMAQQRFAEKQGITPRAAITIWSSNPAQTTALQATDYLLWALQRAYERGEDRYVGYLWSKFSLVHDIDDTREHAYGVYYSQKHPLRMGAKEKPGI